MDEDKVYTCTSSKLTVVHNIDMARFGHEPSNPLPINPKKNNGLPLFSIEKSTKP